MKKKIFFICSFFFSIIISAQQEIYVNTYLDSTQREPAIAIVDKEENISVVWKSDFQVDSSSAGDIYLQFLSSDLQKIGQEILVNDITNGNQINPQISSNKNGKLAIVWASFNPENQTNFYDIKLKLYNNFSVSTNETTVNTYLIGSQTKPRICMKENGEFIVVWESWFQDGSDRGVYAQLFDSLGNKLGDEFLVNTSTEYSQSRPSVQFFKNGNFIVVWESWNELDLGYDLYAKIFDKNGEVVKDEFLVNSFTENYQWFGEVAVSNDNSFDIVWCSWEQDGFDGGIYLKSFNDSFQSLGDEILINSSTEYYQWLPKISNTDDGKKIIMWSSWNIDGSREGVYYKILDKRNNELVLESRSNQYTESFQWEPDFVTLSSNEFIAVWSSWGEIEKDYEIISKKINPNYLTGKLDSEFFEHPNGISTGQFVIHVMDSSKLNGHTYEITFNESGDHILDYSVKDINTSEFKVENYPLNFGANVKYYSNEFDGIIVEILPIFDLEIDFKNSEFVNSTGTNVSFSLEAPLIFPTVAPIDIAIIWGNADTLSDGSFINSLDTAFSASNIREIELPFYTVNLENEEKLQAVVFENNISNKRWDPGETIVFLTPQEFKTDNFSTHVQVFSSVESENIIWPGVGDTNFIRTIKPLTVNDKYLFTTSKNNIILGSEKNFARTNFTLYQNYPNPFNPSTTIRYFIPEKDYVSLSIFNILGERIETLVKDIHSAGNYSLNFNASKYPSGIYFYRLKTSKQQIVKKMLLLK